MGYRHSSSDPKIGLAIAFLVCLGMLFVYLPNAFNGIVHRKAMQYTKRTSTKVYGEDALLEAKFSLAVSIVGAVGIFFIIQYCREEN